MWKWIANSKILYYHRPHYLHVDKTECGETHHKQNTLCFSNNYFSSLDCAGETEKYFQSSITSTILHDFSLRKEYRRQYAAQFSHLLCLQSLKTSCSGENFSLLLSPFYRQRWLDTKKLSESASSREARLSSFLGNPLFSRIHTDCLIPSVIEPHPSFSQTPLVDCTCQNHRSHFIDYLWVCFLNLFS